MKRSVKAVGVSMALILLAATPTPVYATIRASTLSSILPSIPTEADALQKDDLFVGTDAFAKGAKDVTEVNLDKRLLAMMGSFLGAASSGSGEDRKALDLAKKMEFVYVRSYEYEKPGQYKPADLDAFRARLNGAEWSHVVKERSATEQNDVWVRSDDNGTVSELVVISAEQNELSFVHLKGHMTMQELRQAGAKYGVPPVPGNVEAKPKGAK